MQKLFTLTVNEDGECYQLALGMQAGKLVFQYEDRSPEPLDPENGPLHVAWVLLPGRQGVGRQRVVFVGELDSTGAKYVEIDTPYATRSRYPILNSPSRWPRPFFMSAPQVFRPGTVKARWLAKRRIGWHTIHEQHMLLEEWGAITAVASS